MKVALVHNYHSETTPSGENVVVDAESAALTRAGVDVRVIRLDNDQMATRPFHVVQAVTSTATGHGISPLKMLEDFEPDVIHVHNLFPFFGRTWARTTHIPIVTTLHNYRPMCAKAILFRDGKVCTLCIGRSGWAAVRHRCFQDSALASLPLALANDVTKHDVLIKAKKNIVLSERSKRIFLEAGMPESALEREWHFVPENLVGKPKLPVGTRKWLYVGRLTPEKGIDRLVREWPAEEPLVIVGEGELRREIETSAANKRVLLRGSLSRSEVLYEMQQAFGLIVPSLWYETFGLIYIEALSVGLPVIAFPPNVIADEVAAEHTGIVAEWGRLELALDEAKMRFESLRDPCRLLFEKRYAENSWVRRRLALYERVIM